MQCRLFPNLVGEPLSHFTEERARTATSVGPVDIWIFSGVPFPLRQGQTMLRSCKVVIVAVIGS